MNPKTIKSHLAILVGITLLLVSPAAVQAQFNYTTNNNTITITGYTGSGGAVNIPTNVNGLPVTSIAGQAFFFRSSLTSLTIPGTVTSIGDAAFAYCTGLTSVAIPASVTSMGQGVFAYCAGLTSVTIPGSVTSIAETAFLECTNLTSVIIPSGVANIEDYAFQNCTNLTSVIISGSVTSIGDYAFQNCASLTTVYFNGNAPAADLTVFSGDYNAGVYYLPGTTGWSSPFAGLLAYEETPAAEFTYTTNAGTITITGYLGSTGPATIPDIINGLPVASIGAQAFYFSTSLTNVVIPGSVTNIGSDAFSGCFNLNSVTLPGSVTSMQADMFAYCSSLASLSIPASFTSIGSNAFAHSGLTSVTIPRRVSTISEEAFGYCSSLTSVTIPASVTSIGADAFLDCASLTSVTISKGVTSIGADAFAYCSSLTSVTIPASVTSIGADAFLDCASLTSVTISKGVTSIGADAFAYCLSLTAITVAAQNSFYYSSADGVLFNKTQTMLIQCPGGFGGIYKIPGSVTTIGTNAFAYTGLTSVTIPGSVTGIAAGAFFDCASLTSVNFMGNAPAVDSTAFSGDNNAIISYLPGTTGWSSPFAGLPAVAEYTSEAQFNYTPTNGTITGYSGSGGVVIIPDTINGLPVTSIGASAFAGISSITEVTIPATVTTIGNYAFSGCTGLASITIPGSVTSIGTNAFASTGLASITIPAHVTTIRDETFANCTSLNSVTIPESVTSIGNGAFSNCTSLASVTIPDGVTSIGTNAFAYSGLTSVTIPGHVTSMGWDTFAYCGGLTNATISVGVTTISYEEFTDCTNLASVTIPGSVITIGDGAFFGCTTLPSVTISNGVTTIAEDAFAYCTRLARVSIPASVTTIGEDAFAYCFSLTSVTIPGHVTTIGEDAFYSCSSLASITIPGSVIAIRDETFAYCTSLTSVTISNGVTSIGEDAFYSCSSLAGVTIPASVTTIGEYAFAYTGLTSVTIPAKVTTIGDDTFAYCAKLTSVTIPASVTTIRQYAFSGCISLTSVNFMGNAPTADSNAFSGDNNATAYYLPGTTGWNAFSANTGIPAVDPPQTGSLQVTLGPASAINAGAGWQVDGGTWQDSVATVGNLSVGNHTLRFKRISGLTTPPNQIVSIKAKAIARTKGTYTFSAQGIYNGLFMQEDATEETAGMLSGLDVTASGTYSGKLLIGGSTSAISGSFDVSGQASNYVQRTAKQGGPLALEMTLNWNDSPPKITGTVSGTNGGAWVANLRAELAAGVSSSAEYTALVLPDGTPPGYGYILITNNAGAATLSVTLADGTSFSQNVPLSGGGVLPVYGNLYGGTGLLLGWLGLESGSPVGNLTWIKPASRSTAFYTNGFTNLAVVQGSPWVNPLPHTAAMDLPSGQLDISGGSLLAPLAFNVAVSTNNGLVKLAGSSTNSLTGSINTKTGLLTITFGNGAGKATTAGTGAVLQNIDSGGGFFLAKTNAGSILLKP